MRAADSPLLGFVLRNFFDLCLLSHTNVESPLKPFSFCCRGAVLGAACICRRKEDPAPVEKGQNFARITIDFDDDSGNSNPNLDGLLSPVAYCLCQPRLPSTLTDFRKQSNITDDRRKRPPRSGRERKSICTCGKPEKRGEPYNP